MSSTVLTNQGRDAGPFLSAPQKVSPLMISAPSSVPSASTIKRWSKQADSTAAIAFGAWCEVKLTPNDMHLIDIYLQLNLGALGSGNYCVYPALAAITRVQLLYGSEILHDYDYRQAMKACLSLLNDEERNTILAAAGGTSFASGTCDAIIPLFFNRWMAKPEQQMPPFPIHKLKTSLRLRIYIDTAANIAASGATVGTPTISGNFIVTTADSETTDESSNIYQSYDIETKTGQVIATATATDVICDGFTGQISHLAVTNQLSSDLSTAHNYFKSVAIDILKLQIDSDKTYWEADESPTSKLDQLVLKVSKGDPTAASLGILPYWIPIGLTYNPRIFSGSIAMKNVQVLRVNVQHSQGANTQCDVVAFKSAYYKFENEMIKRHLY